ERGRDRALQGRGAIARSGRSQRTGAVSRSGDRVRVGWTGHARTRGDGEDRGYGACAGERARDDRDGGAGRTRAQARGNGGGLISGPMRPTARCELRARLPLSHPWKTSPPLLRPPPLLPTPRLQSRQLPDVRRLLRRPRREEARKPPVEDRSCPPV